MGFYNAPNPPAYSEGGSPVSSVVAVPQQQQEQEQQQAQTQTGPAMDLSGLHEKLERLERHLSYVEGPHGNHVRDLYREVKEELQRLELLPNN